MVTLSKLRKALFRFKPGSMDSKNTTLSVSYILWHAGIRKFNILEGSVYSRRTKVASNHYWIEVGKYTIDYHAGVVYNRLHTKGPFLNSRRICDQEILYLASSISAVSKDSILSEESFKLLQDLHNDVQRAK